MSSFWDYVWSRPALEYDDEGTSHESSMSLREWVEDKLYLDELAKGGVETKKKNSEKEFSRQKNSLLAVIIICIVIIIIYKFLIKK